MMKDFCLVSHLYESSLYYLFDIIILTMAEITYEF